MSYEIVKSIKIIGNKVFMTSASNNVSPREFKEWEVTFWSNILQKDGLKACEISILHSYEDGTSQPGVVNKYCRAIERLHKLPEYKEFNWRVSGIGPEYEKVSENRKTREQEFNELIYRAYCMPEEHCDPVYLAFDHPGSGHLNNWVYVSKVTARRVKFDRSINYAKKFKSEEHARQVITMFPNEDSQWKIINPKEVNVCP